MDSIWQSITDFYNNPPSWLTQAEGLAIVPPWWSSNPASVPATNIAIAAASGNTQSAADISQQAYLNYGTALPSGFGITSDLVLVAIIVIVLLLLAGKLEAL